MEVIEGSVHLDSENDAWLLLERLVKGTVQVDIVPKITLGQWANIDVYIDEDVYDSALTPYMMQGWVDLQRSVYRTYALAASGKADAKGLSEFEKEKLELVVQVKSGSSDQTVDLQEILTKMSLAMVEKMEPTHVLIAIISIALTLGGASITKAWLSAKKEVKLAEIERLKSETTVKAQTAALSTIAEVVGVERARVALLADAARTVPVLNDIGTEASKGREALVHHVTKQDAVINGVHITSEAGQSLTRKTRVEATDVRLDGLYKIRKVDSSVSTGFRVSVVDKSGKELIADVAEVMTTLGDREVIRDAEWNKVPVFLQINARERRGEPIDAKIMRARQFDPETDGVWEADL